MKKIACTILPVLVFTLFGLGQSRIDTAYIQPYRKQLSITPFVSHPSLRLRAYGKTYHPNSPLNMGIGAVFNNTVINLQSTLAGFSLANLNTYGKTRFTGFQVHHYGRKWITDVFYEHYRGFYYKDGNTHSVTSYPDLTSWRTGAEATFLFNGNRYSSRAAFQQKEMQVKSAGSWVLGGGAYVTYVGNPADIGFTESNGTAQLQINLNTGYAYSLVLDKHWLLSGMATGGINWGNDWQELMDGHFIASPAFRIRASAGYARNTWGMYFTLLAHHESIDPIPSETLSFTTVNLQFAFIYHFNSLL